MSRGFIGGILIGAVFSVGVAGVASFMVPMGPAPLQDTPVPSDTPDEERATNASEMAAPPVVAADETPLTAAEDTNEDVITPEPEPVVEEPVVEEPIVEPEPETVPKAEVTPEVEAPVAQEAVQDAPSEDAPDVAAAPETVEPEPQPEPEVAPTPQPAPQIAQDIDATAPVTVPDAAAPKITLDDPVLPNPMALAPMEPTEPDALGIETRTAPPVTADESVDTPVSPTPDTDVATAPSAPDAQPEEAPADVVFVAPEQRTDGRPTIGTPAAITSERDTGVTINRLPTAQSGEQTAPEAQATAESPAITRYGQPFANPDDKPLMSVLLMDVGSDLQGGEVGIAALRSFPYPLSFAVDVSLPDAAERMQTYRNEGFEVLAMVDLPQGAQPSDAETTLAVAFSRMPEVIGVLEGQGAGLQPDRATADQVTAILGQGGYGLVTQDKGLNTMPKLAVKEGVPAAPVFRDFDSKGQTPTVIRRFLDQAAFKAGIEGSVIMMGRMRPETISALLVWGLQDRASQVALAPVSAVLKNATPE
ncbi:MULTISPECIES: divergent polysaccharide deacetylase family protein [unclassified Sulfitobacter]|uniref:divergent polysaccharide deacetylase family protein n=1 Tax=unclassified Sulfitobacter TaxID=196795 RepID=UPI000AB8B80B|nr:MULTISPECIES: divergent polysaccharide deacetylase family protein [unclassified Sulfitobacter]